MRSILIDWMLLFHAFISLLNVFVIIHNDTTQREHESRNSVCEIKPCRHVFCV